MSKDTSAAVAEPQKKNATTATPPALPANPDIETVEFDNPIQRGDMVISEVNINKPKTGALRGLSLSDLLKLDVETVIKLVPRVSTPPLTEPEVASLDPVDFLSISTAVVGFFASKQQREKARQETKTTKAEASLTA